MKKSGLIPLFFLAVFVLVFISACGLKKEAEPQEPNVIIITATPAAEVETVVTEPPVIPTEPVVVVTDAPVEPTATLPADTPTETATTIEDTTQDVKFFRDEFDDGLDNYSHFMFNWKNEFRIHKNNKELEKAAGVELDNGRVKFNMKAYDLGYYFVYESQTYEDVKVSMEVENLGYNASSAALFCRYDEDMGWYQLTVDFQGLWALWYYDAMIEKGFNYLTNGGAAQFDYGKGKNTFTLVCDENQISVYVNDVLSQTFEDENLTSGKVGFGARTDNTYTVMNVPWFEISEP